MSSAPEPRERRAGEPGALGRNKDTMKLENRRQVLELIARQPLSRAGLAKKTGLTQSAVGNMVGDLLQAGIVREVQSPPEEAALGRRPILLEVNPSWKTVIGVSIDRDGIEVGLSDMGGRGLGKTVSLPCQNDPQAALDTIAQAVEGLLRDQRVRPERILGLGAIVPGPVNASRGVLLNPPRFEGWHGFPLKDQLSRRLSVPVYVEHNASAAARAQLNAGFPCRSFALLLINDGIGLGLVLHGQVYTGANGLGCELGHTSIDLHGRPCACGNRGCLELYASTSAILYDARRSRPDIASWTQLVDAAWNGDAYCGAMLDLQAEYLAASVINLNNLLELEAILLGGAAAYRGELLMEKLEKQVRQRVLSKDNRSLTFHLIGSRELSPSTAAGAVVLDQLFRGELFLRELGGAIPPKS